MPLEIQCRVTKAKAAATHHSARESLPNHKAAQEMVQNKNCAMKWKQERGQNQCANKY